MNHEQWNLEHDRLAGERRLAAFEMVGLVTSLVQWHDITKKPPLDTDWDRIRIILSRYETADKALDAFWEAHPHCDLLPNPEEEAECTTQKQTA